MNRVESKNEWIARRTPLVVVVLQSQGVQQRKTPFLDSTLTGQGFAGSLQRCVASEGHGHSTAPRALHPIPQSRCASFALCAIACQKQIRGHEDLFRVSLGLLDVTPS